MTIGEICSREVIVAEAEDTVLVAARLMREHHVGNVLVVEARDGKRVPIGIVTDRDVVVEVLALELDPGAITVGDIMVPNLVTVKESTGVSDAIECMRTRGVRRLPVVNEDGGLAGIVTLDDLLALLADEFYALGGLLTREQLKEASARR